MVGRDFSKENKGKENSSKQNCGMNLKKSKLDAGATTASLQELEGQVKVGEPDALNSDVHISILLTWAIFYILLQYVPVVFKTSFFYSRN